MGLCVLGEFWLALEFFRAGSQVFGVMMMIIELVSVALLAGLYQNMMAEVRCEILQGNMMCESRVIAGDGDSFDVKQYFVGGHRVYPEAEWLTHWPEGQVVAAELCPFILRSGRSAEALLISLPGIHILSARPQIR